MFLTQCCVSVTFLVPYVVMFFLVALPMTMMEIALGQYTTQGPVTCWKMAPLGKGRDAQSDVLS